MASSSENRRKFLKASVVTLETELQEYECSMKREIDAVEQELSRDTASEHLKHQKEALTKQMYAEAGAKWEKIEHLLEIIVSCRALSDTTGAEYGKI